MDSFLLECLMQSLSCNASKQVADKMFLGLSMQYTLSHKIHVVALDRGHWIHVTLEGVALDRGHWIHVTLEGVALDRGHWIHVTLEGVALDRGHCIHVTLEGVALDRGHWIHVTLEGVALDRSLEACKLRVLTTSTIVARESAMPKVVSSLSFSCKRVYGASRLRRLVQVKQCRASPNPPHGSAADKRLAFLDPEALVINDAVAGKLQHFARLPPQSDVNEWLATNCLAFFHQINTQVGVIGELCTQQGCPSMCAGKEIFEWLEDRKGNKKHKTPAKQYINTALEQIHKILQDEEQFPTKFGMLNV
eukprot:Em0003g986a